MKNKIKNKLGFTLLELLVVVVIIGILAAVAMPQYRKVVAKAELSRVISAVKVIDNAQERYYLMYNSYTRNLENLDVQFPNGDVVCLGTSLRHADCRSQNFIITHYYSQDENVPNLMECFTKNEILAGACKNFLHKDIYPSSSSMCEFLFAEPCYRVAKYIVF